MISRPRLGGFLSYYMVRRVIASRDTLMTVGKAIRRFIGWLHRKGYMEKDDYRSAAELVDMLREDLLVVNDMFYYLQDYVDANRPADIVKTVEGYYMIKRIREGKLWFEEIMGSGRRIGPVPVSSQISSMCKVGWSLFLTLGRTDKGWRILESGAIYPVPVPEH